MEKSKSISKQKTYYRKKKGEGKGEVREIHLKKH